MKNFFKLVLVTLVLAIGSNAMADGFGRGYGHGYGGRGFEGGRGGWVAPAVVGLIAGAAIYEATRPAPVVIQQQPVYGYIPPAVAATQYPRYPEAQYVYPQATATGVPQCISGYRPTYIQQPDGNMLYQGCR